MKREKLSDLDIVTMRQPDQVMQLDRLGSFHASRLSFMRVLLRKFKRENWTFTRGLFDLDIQGVGVATYIAKGPERTYTLVCFANDLPDERRSDRVIAEEWDATFTLFDGEPTQNDIERLRNNVPLQEAGRISEKEFCLSRANRSVRMFDHVLDRLSAGKQPDIEMIENIGYLMRTTAVYGSGKFGAADRSVWASRPEFSGAFQPEMLTVWLIRQFAIDCIEHLAKCKGGDKAVKLAPDMKRMLGIGNSTGLGMAPFLMKHPELIHTWVHSRELALARVRLLRKWSNKEFEVFSRALSSAKQNVECWLSIDDRQSKKIAALKQDLCEIEERLRHIPNDQDYPWNWLYRWSEARLCVDAQELLVSLMLEPYGELIDSLSNEMSFDEPTDRRIDGTVSVQNFHKTASDIYGWAQEFDFTKQEETARVWYVSQEKLEPRLGLREGGMLDAYEQALAPARDAAAMLDDLEAYDQHKTLASFLLEYPQHRHAARRAQRVANFPYGEIRANTISENLLPIDLLRCKLSFFGAAQFDPRSDRWVRINMYKSAPYPDEMAGIDCGLPENSKWLI